MKAFQSQNHPGAVHQILLFFLWSSCLLLDHATGLGVGLGKKLYGRPRHSRAYFAASSSNNNNPIHSNHDGEFGTKLTSHIRYINEPVYRPLIVEEKKEVETEPVAFPASYDLSAHSKLRYAHSFYKPLHHPVLEEVLEEQEQEDEEEDNDDGPRFSRLIAIHPDLQLLSSPEQIVQETVVNSRPLPVAQVDSGSVVQNAHPNGRMKFLSQVIGMHLKPRAEELLEEEEEEDGDSEQGEGVKGEDEEDEEASEHKEVVKQVLRPGSAINDYLSRIGNKYRYHKKPYNSGYGNRLLQPIPPLLTKYYGK